MALKKPQGNEKAAVSPISTHSGESKMKTGKKYCCYELVEPLGAGSMGEVWRAKHRMLTRPAAIKFIRPEVLGASSESDRKMALARFQREAQTIAAMRSPHTIDLYDFGVSDDGAFYYVMELLDGMDLDALVRRFGPVSSQRTIHFLSQICDSLAEAHEHGLIHRDVKPANVYACRYGRKVDFIKVLDFGLVKPRRPLEEGDPLVTAESVASGTPAYMAPEQVLGDRPVDARTDMYAVGCLGYWLLTGHLVFEGETVIKVLMDHAQTRPVPPSERAELDIPKTLDEVIMSCLEKDPADRPQDADALVERLASCSTAKSWTAESARSWWSVHVPDLMRSGGTASADGYTEAVIES